MLNDGAVTFIYVQEMYFCHCDLFLLITIKAKQIICQQMKDCHVGIYLFTFNHELSTTSYYLRLIKLPLCDYQRKGTFINQYLKGHPKTTHNPRNRHRLFCEGIFSFWASAYSPSVVSDSSVRLSVRPGIRRVSSITLSYPNPFFFFCGKYR